MTRYVSLCDTCPLIASCYAILWCTEVVDNRVVYIPLPCFAEHPQYDAAEWRKRQEPKPKPRSVKNFLRDAARKIRKDARRERNAEIVARVRSGIRQSQIAKELGMTRAVIHYIMIQAGD